MIHAGRPPIDSLLARLARNESVRLAVELTTRIGPLEPHALGTMLASIYLSAFTNGAAFAMTDVEYTGEMLRAGEVADLLPIALSAAAEYMRDHPLMAPPADEA